MVSTTHRIVNFRIYIIVMIYYIHVNDGILTNLLCTYTIQESS
jgi:hypothetical protein